MVEKLHTNRRLNLSALNFSDRVISYDTAVEAKPVMEFSKEVVLGDSSIKISRAEKDYIRKSVKLEIYYEKI